MKNFVGAQFIARFFQVSRNKLRSHKIRTNLRLLALRAAFASKIAPYFSASPSSCVTL
jgi:hypothetical protein